MYFIVINNWFYIASNENRIVWDDNSVNGGLWQCFLFYCMDSHVWSQFYSKYTENFLIKIEDLNNLSSRLYRLIDKNIRCVFKMK